MVRCVRDLAVYIIHHWDDSGSHLMLLVLLVCSKDS